MKKEIKVNMEKLLEKAEREMPGFDMVIDVLSMTVVYITEEAAAIADRTPEEMVGKRVTEVSAFEEDDENFIEAFLSALSGKAKIPVLTKSGEVIKMVFEFVSIGVETRPFLLTKVIDASEKSSSL